MNRRIAIAILALLIVLLVIWLWSSQKQAKQGALASPQSVQSGTYPTKVEEEKNSAANSTSAPLPIPQSEETKKANRMKLIAGIISSLNTPITFYGKVIDQNDNPVPYASIEYETIDKFDADGSKYQGATNADGSFTISGIKGAVLLVGVRKDGYYMIHEKSNGAFAYGVGPDSTRKSPPTKENPAIFILQKMGQTEPLIMIESRTFLIARNGKPLIVDLSTGRVSNNGQLQVEAWTEDESVPLNSGQHYNWKCRVSIVNGGIVERQGQFDFEAPLEGYRTADEIVMLQTAERWQKQVERNYFAKLASGQYARIAIKMVAGGDHFFRMESYLNPTPGSRNLEFDPAKRINAK